jgi:RHS repeat-associated protein
MNARYYNGTIGRFISQDPLAIESLQTEDNKKFQYLLANPQNWNTYSYALNNPLVASDPSGLLTIVIPGTWHDSGWQKSDEGKQYLARVSDTFHETAVVFNWSGDDNRLARIGAGFDLARMVNGHEFKSGEQLNIVAHSHGGTVAVLGAPFFNRAVDNLVTLGTPSRNDNQVSRLVNILNHVQVYDSNDQVQQAAGNATSLSEKFGGMFFGEKGARIGRALGWGEYGPALREFSGARNIDVSKLQGYRNDGGITNHGNLWSKADGLNAARSYLRILK